MTALESPPVEKPAPIEAIEPIEEKLLVESPKAASLFPELQEKPDVSTPSKLAAAVESPMPVKSEQIPVKEISPINQKKLGDLENYEKICQKLLPMALIGYIEPMKQQILGLRDQVQIANSTK